MRRTIYDHESRIRDHVRPRARGVTLLEMIVVISITGIVAAIVAVFIRMPVEGYVDAARRAELTDVADTALRRITRDVRTALPNSIRISIVGNVRYLEYLQTSGGARYRSEVTSAGGGDILDFTAADSTFDVLGPLPAFTGGESIVIYNLTSSGAAANAYVGDNRAAGSGAGGTITLTAAKLFPFQSPGKRFQVVQYPVTYACDPLPLGAGHLRRYWDYTIDLAQPTPPVTANNALLATNVSDCGFIHSTGGATGQTGVLALTLQVTQSGETVRLFQQVHVSNVP